MLTLKTTDTQLRHLQHSVNEAREGSEGIRVSKAALAALLLDHHAMNGALARRKEQPNTPEEN
ncbi:hypothetical protein UFOVP823_8 [uncultured Caudovirales phage]|uniref:Uncharacterized protein n=1 Tax=uncultured Caudovirales phage TaxID=2100421 RepID=A0A6J5P1A4_9CAUD|nr:hypothetical protein UFOVP823_8 [uncultured Caudovirales phage]